MRKYQPIWERLKKRDRVVLEVEPWLARRVKKAVIKEKDSDIPFKIMNELERLRLVFEYSPETKRMTIALVAKFNIVPIERG